MRLKTSRRRFLAGSSALGAITLLPRAAAAALTQPAQRRDVLVTIFLHGGMDGLHLLAPVDDPDYIAARPADLRIAANGTNAGLTIANAPTKQDWRLHPSAAPLKTLYDSGKLAFVHAAGLPADTRSHFQATDLMERGITDPSRISSATGWLTRHMRNDANALGTVSTSTMVPGRLFGDAGAVAIDVPSSFALYDSDFEPFLRAIHQGSALAQPGIETLDALDAFNARLAPPGDASSDQSDLDTAIDTVLTVLGMNVSLQAATLDVQDWDTHSDQARRLSANVADLATSLARFQSRVEALGADVTLVAMTEFGRRLSANDSGGTDHGHGSAMLVLGKGINGGRIYGTWPGLSADQLNDGDLDITTDYRNVLAEVLIKRRGETDAASVFPDLAAYQPLGIAKPQAVASWPT